MKKGDHHTLCLWCGGYTYTGLMNENMSSLENAMHCGVSLSERLKSVVGFGLASRREQHRKRQARARAEETPEQREQARVGLSRINLCSPCSGVSSALALARGSLSSLHLANLCTLCSGISSALALDLHSLSCVVSA